MKSYFGHASDWLAHRSRADVRSTSRQRVSPLSAPNIYISTSKYPLQVHHQARASCIVPVIPNTRAPVYLNWKGKLGSDCTFQALSIKRDAHHSLPTRRPTRGGSSSYYRYRPELVGHLALAAWQFF